jgi:hypothetical protein
MTSRRLGLTLATVLVCAAAAAGSGCSGTAPGDPRVGLTAGDLQRFADRKEALCAECHSHPTPGGGAPPARPDLRELRSGG